MFTRARDVLLSVPQPYYTSDVYVGPHWRRDLRDVHLELLCRHYYRGSEKKWYDKFYLMKDNRTESEKHSPTRNFAPRTSQRHVTMEATTCQHVSNYMSAWKQQHVSNYMSPWKQQNPRVSEKSTRTLHFAPRTNMATHKLSIILSDRSSSSMRQLLKHDTHAAGRQLQNGAYACHHAAGQSNGIGKTLANLNIAKRRPEWVARVARTLC